MSEYQTRIKSLIITPKGKPIFDEQATEVMIDDEASGEFIKIVQYREEKTDYPTVTFNGWDEFQHVVDAVKMIQKEIEKGSR